MGFAAARRRYGGHLASLLAAGAIVSISGCTLAPLSERALQQEIPLAKNVPGDDVALIAFSADSKYESERGVPLEGDPLICSPEGLARVNGQNLMRNQIIFRAGEEIAVASVIRCSHAGWQKTCWPFVSFTPERGAIYVVVNERIGGKGAAALWTGVGLQSCEVSVFRLHRSGPRRIETRDTSVAACQAKAD